MCAALVIRAHGPREAGYALTNIIGMTNANLRPLTLKRSLKQRASGRLKQLEVIVRRLLTLMALALTLAPVRPRINPAPDRALSGQCSCFIRAEFVHVLRPGACRARPCPDQCAPCRSGKSRRECKAPRTLP